MTRTAATIMPTISARELSTALGQRHPPTDEQIAVIEAALEPLLVVAGAGSGKTETMAARVVYLVANGMVAPEHILGLTFTRKASAGLLKRIRQRLARLGQSEVLSPEIHQSVQSTEPTVLTYHAFGGRLLSEYGALVGVEPSARILTDTSSWQLASSVVRRWDGDLDVDLAPDRVTERLLQLSGVLADHLRAPDELSAVTAELAERIRLAPPAARQRSPIHSDLKPLYLRLTNRHGILPLVRAFQEAKRTTSSLDFGDQMQLASALVTQHPRVVTTVRERYRVVLLDEYQDTGHSQRVILSAIFGAESGSLGHPVTAVGDPCQSIYGWRGAAASNLPRFRTDFPRRDGEPALRMSLLTSFRNPTSVLAVANTLSAPIRAALVPVDELRPRPGADSGEIGYGLFHTVDDEDSWVADSIADRWLAAEAAGRRPPSSAVLFRRRSGIAGVAERLTARGIPVEISGLAGLLSEPEVVEMVSMLRLLVDPTAGNAVIRILGGARWNIGLGDLAALHQRARALNRLPGSCTGAPESSSTGDLSAGRQSVRAALQQAEPGEDAESASLLDAIADPGSPTAYSEAGFERIRRLNSELRWLRGRLSAPLTDLFADIEHLIGLDVEVAVAGGPGRANLDAFAEVVAEFVSGGGGRSVPTTTDLIPGLRGSQALDLLGFLTIAADAEEGLALGEVEQKTDAVQLLTVHAAKGLEWELVCVPHLCQKVFPGDKSSTWLSDDGHLPPQLRGDHLDLPTLSIPDGADQKEIGMAVARHKAEWKDELLAEERRLLYVALTRAEQTLLLSGHWWSRTGAAPRGPSSFLQELAAAAAPFGPPVNWADEPEEGAANPLTISPTSAQWPVDGLAGRRAAVVDGASLVEAAIRRAGSYDPRSARGNGPAVEADADPYRWQRDIDALLGERRAHENRRYQVELPASLSVSSLVSLAADPEQLARHLRRPMPMPPADAARRGTEFHAWLERFYRGEALLDLDELPGSDDRDTLPGKSLDQLKDAFLVSQWAQRVPHEQEVPFATLIGDLPVRGRMDAVFADDDGGWTVVDWKTGREPSAAHLESAAVQLAAYRLAWAELADCDLDLVRAAFYYVGSGNTVAPTGLLDAEGLFRIVRRATESDPDATGARHNQRAGEAQLVGMATSEP